MLRKLLPQLLISCVLVMVIPSCELINPEEEIPAYIHVDTCMVESETNEGSASHYIHDGWLYVDNKLIGIFEIPFTVPVLKTGEQEVTLEAGIKVNGISTLRRIYPFYSSYTVNRTLIPEKVDSIRPEYNYEAGCEFALIENFETLGSVFEETESSDTTIEAVSGTMAFEGNSAAIYLDDTHSVFDAWTVNRYAISKTSPVYVEFNFKTDQEFSFGIFAREYTGSGEQETRYPKITLNPTDEWKKIYVELTDDIANTPMALDYRLFFSAVLSDESESAEIFIDNVKLIYYQ